MAVKLVNMESQTITHHRNYAFAFALISLALIAFGLVMAYSASFADSIDAGISPFAGMRMQFIAAFLGITAAVGLWRVLPMRWLSGSAAYVIWAVCFIMVLYTAIWGTYAYGARRWLDIGFVEFQPSELMKIAIVILCAKILAEYRSGELELKRAVILFILAAGLPLGVILVGQSDFGTTLICVVGILVVMILGGVPARIIVPFLVLGALGAVFAVFGTEYRRDRVAVWLDPWSDGQNGLGDGYQMVHSYYALAEGGMFGVGLGQSHEKFQYLPFAPNDFIFAIVGEELGWLGAGFVVFLFIALLVSGLLIAFSCTDDFGKMVSGAIVVMIVAEAFLNIGCVVGLLPVTGKPLPFFSMGGTALLVTTASLGLVLAASRDADGGDLYAKRRDNLRLVRGQR